MSKTKGETYPYTDCFGVQFRVEQGHGEPHEWLVFENRADENGPYEHEADSVDDCDSEAEAVQTWQQRQFYNKRADEGFKRPNPDLNVLFPDLSATERGNVLLSHTEENWLNAWIRLGNDQWLQISYRDCNYPALNVSTIDATDQQLAEHINREFAQENYSGSWRVDKCNVEGVILDEQGTGFDDKTCQKCGTSLDHRGEYCLDETCPYSDHLQSESFTVG